MTLDFNKPVRTKCGFEVRIYSVDAGGPYPVHGAYKELNSDRWNAASWTTSGKLVLLSLNTDIDLVNVPVKRTLDVWLNVYSGSVATANRSNTEADQIADPTRIACLHIVREFEEGEGL